MKRASFAVAVVAAALILPAPSAPALAELDTAQNDAWALRCGRVLAGDRLQPDRYVLVRGNTIESITDTAPDGYATIDLSSATCLPGLIDAHSHILLQTDSYQIDHLRSSSATKALKGLAAAQANLHHGWTTLRIAGDGDVFYAHLDVGKAIKDGLFIGPRITGAGHYLSVTGGGGDMNQIAPEQRVVADGRVVDGPDEIRKAIREEIKFGSTWIKLLVTGAFMSTGDNPQNVQFSPEELAAAVEEADRRGTPVMAHAHATAGIKMAVEAGVRSIEHGTFMDDEAMSLMLEHGTWWVPTAYIGRYYINEGSDAEDLGKALELTRRYQADFEDRVREGIRRGVKIAVGSDFGGYEQARNVGEIETLVDLGMTPRQAIQAATIVSAEMLGWEDRIGSIEAGKLADIIAVDGDPFVDIAALRSVRFVMVDGSVARHE